MSHKQIPRGPDNLTCPLHKASMETVCHTCPWWQQIRGKHPQSLEDLDRWDCAIAFLPMLLIENSQRQIQTAAGVDKVANEIKKADEEGSVMMGAMLTQIGHAVGALSHVMERLDQGAQAPRQINGEAPRLLIEQ